MTFYVLFNSMGIREETFAWYERGEEKFWFAGATFTKDGWVPNPISWDRYYVMTSNQGIGVWKNKIALVENGKEALVVRIDPIRTKIVQPNRFFTAPTVPDLMANDPKCWSAWYEIKKLLETVYPSEESREILSVMNKWEGVSCQTALWVKETLESQADPQDIVEIYVAGHQWLWHNSTKGVVIIGHKEQVWGNTRLHSGEAIITRGALPIHNGWLVGLACQDKYLLRWNGHGVKAQTFVFPYGPWEDRGVWRCWGDDQAVLTSKNQLVAISPLHFCWGNEYQDWISFFERDLGSRMLLINHQGESLYLDLSRYPNGNFSPGIYPRERCMLIDHLDDHGWRVFSLISLSPVASVKRSPRPLWQIRVAPPSSVVRVIPYFLYIKDGTTEIFVFLFDMNDHYWGIGLINERRQFWISPFLFKGVFSGCYVDVDKAKRNDEFVVRFYGAPSGSKTDLIVIRISNGQIHMQFDTGVTISEPLVSFPKREDGLWPYLVSALGPERVSKKQQHLSSNSLVV